MLEQFRPRIDLPLDEKSIEGLLMQRLDYWPHSYALCLLSAERNRHRDAIQFFDIFNRSVADKDFPWVHERRHELEQALGRFQNLK
jgi:hypothetical protein